jgi:hypothetical protein
VGVVDGMQHVHTLRGPSSSRPLIGGRTGTAPITSRS